MSKAFTSENDESLEEELQDTPLLLPPGAKNYMTAAGAEAFREELKTLMSQKRPQLVRDSSPQGKTKLRELDRRIRFLEKRLEIVQVVEVTAQTGDRVLFGSKVEVLDEQKQTKIYQLVGIDEADPKIGKISWISPLAKCLLNAEVGDVVTFKTPGGSEELEILSINQKSP